MEGKNLLIMFWTVALATFSAHGVKSNLLVARSSNLEYKVSNSFYVTTIYNTILNLC